MMSAGSQNPGAPCVLRAGKDGSLRGGRARKSTISFVALLIAFAVTFFASARAVQAQIGTVNPHGGHGPVLQTAEPGFTPTTNSRATPADYSRLIHQEACESWTEAAVYSPTVSVARLAVPAKARGEFQKACGKLKLNNFPAADAEARKAVEIYPDYAAAWVVLGQALTGENKVDQAVQACKRAMKVDPTYAPPYICLAQFAERTNDWDDVYEFSDRARSLDPAHNAYPYFYAAMADLHLKRYAQAEFEGRSAERLDTDNDIPRLHLLLAQVYRATGDKTDEAIELHKFLQSSPHDSEWQNTRATLAAIQGSAAK